MFNHKLKEIHKKWDNNTQKPENKLLLTSVLEQDIIAWQQIKKKLMYTNLVNVPFGKHLVMDENHLV